jgi:CTP:molybdopterin cytidylyltransferase MocA
MQNKQWHRGIGSSIRCGIRGLIKNSPDVEASVLLVCDQPAVDARVIERLIALRETTRKSIIASSYADTLRVPALLTVRFFRNCFHSMIKPARNRSFREIGIGLRSLRSHKAKLISIPGNIGKNSIDGASLNEVKDLHKLINCAV